LKKKFNEKSKKVNWIIQLFQIQYLTRSKNLVAKIAKKHSEITADLLDPTLSGALLNSMTSSIKIETEKESQL